MRLMIATTMAAALGITPLLAADNEPAKRLNDAAVVFSEIMATPDKGIPQELLEKAHCIVIVPDLKTAAFVVGGKYGKGYMSCRNTVGTSWSAPGTVRIEGGSVGFQIGGSSTDLIMLVMSERGADKLLSSKFTLGAEGSVAAGPVGRTATAQTDVQMRADILSWSRSQGVFAGLALEGATLRQDLDDIGLFAGRPLRPDELTAVLARGPTICHCGRSEAIRSACNLDRFAAALLAMVGASVPAVGRAGARSPADRRRGNDSRSRAVRSPSRRRRSKSRSRRDRPPASGRCAR